MRSRIVCLTALALLALAPPALAQDIGTLNPKPLPPLADPTNPNLPAKQVFGRAMTPLEVQTRSIGFYSRGCLAGAKALPVDGESWQVVRLSRNRMWGNPAMISFLERFSRKAKAEGIWNGILVGDISQPRGGPMLTGHASHQIGLDADVWLTPMPDRTLSREEREEMSAVDMVTEDGRSVDRAHWSEAQAGIIRAAAEEPEVERIFVNAAIKKALCETPRGRVLDEQGAPLLGPQLPLPHPHPVPRRRGRLRTAGPGPARRRLRQVAELVVHRRGAAPAPGQAEAAADGRATAARVPDGGAGEVGGRAGAVPGGWRAASALVARTFYGCESLFRFIFLVHIVRSWLPWRARASLLNAPSP